MRRCSWQLPDKSRRSPAKSAVAVRYGLLAKPQTYENLFFTRNHRLCTPSRQAFSFVSPRRELYRIEISPKTILGCFSASILISSENDMLSDSSLINDRMLRRNTHMPDCESRTQWKYSSEVASESARF